MSGIKTDRTYEDLPYCLFVSSKVSKDKKNPLIVSPHAAAPAAPAAPAAQAPPANLAELSEKDAMNELAMMRKEFNVDDNRTYLMGHSMGGAGTYVRE